MYFTYVCTEGLKLKPNRYIKSVTFKVTYDGEVVHTIPFDYLRTERDAVRAAQYYLTQPMTYDYYNSLREHTTYLLSEIDFPNYDLLRGNLLLNDYYLNEIIQLTEDSVYLHVSY